jgi:hypothetical protein
MVEERYNVIYVRLLDLGLCGPLNGLNAREMVYGGYYLCSCALTLCLSLELHYGIRTLFSS